MLKNFRIFILATLILASGHPAETQQRGKIYRISYLAARSALEPRDEAFRQGLRDLGYVEGKDIIIEYRFAGGKREQIPKLAAELVRLKVDMIVAPGTPVAQAAKTATSFEGLVTMQTGSHSRFWSHIHNDEDSSTATRPASTFSGSETKAWKNPRNSPIQ